MLPRHIAFFLGFGLYARGLGFPFPRLENHTTYYFVFYSHLFILQLILHSSFLILH